MDTDKLCSLCRANDNKPLRSYLNNIAICFSCFHSHVHLSQTVSVLQECSHPRALLRLTRSLNSKICWSVAQNYTPFFTCPIDG